MSAPSPHLHPDPNVSRRCRSLGLAIEIGGTTTRLARFDHRSGHVPAVLHMATPNYLTHPALGEDAIMRDVFERIRSEGARLFDEESPHLIVAAYSGPVSDGVAQRSPTILGPNSRRKYDIRGALRALWPAAQVHVQNDLTCAGYYYARQGYRDFCIITVGSGVGNKVFLDGHPHVGKRQLGGEIGHLRMSPQPETAVAHLHAELGQLASGRGTVWLAERWNSMEGGRPLSSQPASLENTPECASELLVNAFRSHDARAIRVVRAGAHPLALAIGAMHLGIGIDKFLIVGGFAKALGEEYRTALVEMCHELTWEAGQKWDDMIELGREGIDEGVLGAACYGAQCVVEGQVEC